MCWKFPFACRDFFKDFPKRGFFRAVDLRQLIEEGIGNTTSWNVDDPKERLFIFFVCNDAKISEKILDFASFRKFEPSKNLIGNAPDPMALFLPRSLNQGHLE